jgi:hypothetical protein
MALCGWDDLAAIDGTALHHRRGGPLAFATAAE